jgi:hypothetical protein
VRRCDCEETAALRSRLAEALAVLKEAQKYVKDEPPECGADCNCEEGSLWRRIDALLAEEGGKDA